ncbi:hypothetical protein NDU88_004536 [Pleurodeles waltl]|uniref:Secreted protein n=1 Tax=Pleurodeles waltl TaxID=8319 RepID=A0AAV7VKK8_PLEWA|nr:hypothetical protein NDU88_004536 [Pleurodeles waltl]
MRRNLYRSLLPGLPSRPQAAVALCAAPGPKLEVSPVAESRSASGCASLPVVRLRCTQTRIMLQAIDSHHATFFVS